MNKIVYVVILLLLNTCVFENRNNSGTQEEIQPEPKPKTVSKEIIKPQIAVVSEEIDFNALSKKCNVQAVLKVKNTLNSISYQDVYNFFLSFDSSCKNNAEYTEFSNEVLFKLLIKQPKAFLDVLGQSKDKIDYDYILKEIGAPLLDYDIKKILVTLDTIQVNNNVLSDVKESLKKVN